jgi:histidinol phosphatase-like PHP family hydrolase
MKNRELLLSQKFDCHVHTPRSACCEDTTLEKIRDKAEKLNINYTITDHSAHLYFPKELAWSMMRDDFPEVFAAHRKAGRKAIKEYITNLRERNLIVGIELDIYSDGTIVFEEDLFPEFDIVVGSIHLLDTLLKKKTEKMVIEEFKRLTLKLISCGEVDIIGHPFRMLVRADIPVSNELINWLVNKCCKYDVALEINSHYKFPDIDLKMTKVAMRKNVLLVKGSDAHAMKEFGDYSYHNEILQKAKNSLNRRNSTVKNKKNVNRKMGLLTA